MSKQVVKKAIKFYNQSKEAVDDLIKIDKDLIDINQASFNLKDSLILATDKKKIEDVKAETQTQKEIGYDVAYLDDEELKDHNINAYGGLKCGPDINLNPYAFVLRLLKTASEKYNLEIVEGVKFKKAHKENNQNIVTLEIAGNKIRTSFKKIVIATGYNPPEQFQKSLENVEIYKTYVAVTNPVEISDKEDLLVWEVKDALKYKKDLVKSANSMFVEKKEMHADYNYAALFGISKDNLPYMGVDPENEDIFVVCGVGGNGTVYSKIASTMVVKWIKGESLSDYSAYKLARQILFKEIL